MSFPAHCSSLVKQYNENPLRVQRNTAAQLAYQSKIAFGAIQAPTNITGVTISLSTLTDALRPTNGNKVLSFVFSTKKLSFDSGAGVDVSVDGTYTIIGQDGRKIVVTVVAGSLPGTDQQDTLEVYTGKVKDFMQILSIKGPKGIQKFVTAGSGSTYFQSNMLLTSDNGNNKIQTPLTNITGVQLVFTGLTQPNQLVQGKHSFVFTFSGTTLAVDGGTGVDIHAGGTFTITAPNGKQVKAIVTGASIPGSDKTDSGIVVTDYIAYANTRLDRMPGDAMRNMAMHL